MVRTIPPDRLRQLIDTATEVFIKQGYQRTQMEDVASALGLGKGTLYGYVESKGALFDAAVRFADGHEPLPDVSALPLPTPAPGSTAQAVQLRLAREAGDLELLAALSRKRPRNVAAELEAIIRDLYVRMARNRRGIKLVDRCAQDQPDLAEVWFGQGRWGQHAALVAYLEQRSSARLLRRVPAPAIAARLILETIAFWAVHRHWDPSPQPVDEKSVQDAVVDLLLHGLIQEPT
jgi:AcrR family transcriptional regulator